MFFQCDKLCGEGEQKRNLVCYRKENGKITVLTDADCIDVKPETTKKCIIKPCEGVDYVTSSWSGVGFLLYFKNTLSYSHFIC